MWKKISDIPLSLSLSLKYFIGPGEIYSCLGNIFYVTLPLISAAWFSPWQGTQSAAPTGIFSILLTIPFMTCTYWCLNRSIIWSTISEEVFFSRGCQFCFWSRKQWSFSLLRSNVCVGLSPPPQGDHWVCTCMSLYNTQCKIPSKTQSPSGHYCTLHPHSPAPAQKVLPQQSQGTHGHLFASANMPWDHFPLSFTLLGQLSLLWGE